MTQEPQEELSTEDKDAAEFEAAFADDAPADQPADEAGSDSKATGEESQEDPPADDTDEESSAGTEDKADDADEAPSAEATEEIDWGDPDAVRNAFDRLNAEKQQLDHKLKSDKGRVARLTNEVGVLRDQIAKAKLEGDGAAEEQATEDLDELLKGEEFQKLRKDFGDDLNPLIRATEATFAENRQLKSRLEGIEQRLSQQSSEAAMGFYDQERAKVDEAHPDWMDQLRDPKFGEWLETQPSMYRKVLDDNWQNVQSAEDVNELFTRYKDQTSDNNPSKEAAATDARRQRQLAGAQTVTTKGPKASSAVPDDDFEAQFLAAKID